MSVFYHQDSTGLVTELHTEGLNRLSELAHGLYQTGEYTPPWGASPQEVADASFDVIVDLFGRDQPPLQLGMQYILWLIPDSADMADTSQLHDLADYINVLLAGGKKVLIKCQAGINRSSLLAALVLMRCQGLNGPQAIDRIRLMRSPDALCNSTFRTYLESLV